MNILIGCESSGTIRDAFRRVGHNAWSCDLLPTEVDGPHYQCDVFDALARQLWDMFIVHPSCTYLTSSGLHWNGRVEGRAQKIEEALDFVRRLLAVDVPRLALENPQGCISTRIKPATQYIQPYEFGDDASKRTGLWLKNLPPLVGAKPWHVNCPPRFVVDPKTHKTVARWSNQTDGGQNKLTPSPDRWKLRSRTYQGIADAMVRQWGGLDPRPVDLFSRWTR